MSAGKKDSLRSAFEDMGLGVDLESGTSLQLVRPETIPEAEPFSRLFPKGEEVLNAIVDSMRAIGFDPSHPVMIWKNRDGGPALIDGYTRKAAAILAGIDQIPMVYKEFDTEKDAIDYAFAQQFRRRNLSDQDRLTLLIQWGESLVSGIYVRTNINTPGRPSKALNRKNVAAILNVSEALAGRYIAVLEGGEELRSRVLSGELSVHQASEKAREEQPKRRVEKAKPEPSPSSKAFSLSWSPDFHLRNGDQPILAMNADVIGGLSEKERQTIMTKVSRVVEAFLAKRGGENEGD